MRQQRGVREVRQLRRARGRVAASAVGRSESSVSSREVFRELVRGVLDARVLAHVLADRGHVRALAQGLEHALLLGDGAAQRHAARRRLGVHARVRDRRRPRLWDTPRHVTAAVAVERDAAVGRDR